MLKRTLSVLLIGAFIAMSLSACKSQPKNTPETTTQQVTTAEPTASGGDEDPAVAMGLPAYTGEPVELRFTWWGSDTRAERTNKVIELFQQAYPAIKITGEPKPSDSYWDTLATQLAGGDAPDIMQFGGNYPDYTTYLTPLQDFVGKQLQVSTAEEFDQAPIATGTLGGNLYGICLGTNSLVLFYNKTMLEAAGCPLPPETWTWDEMIEYGKEIKDKLPDGVYPFVDNSVNQANYLSYFFRQIDEPLWTSEEKTYATVEGCTEWFKLWEDMRAEGLIPDIETTAGYAETSVDNSIFVAGQAAIGLFWTNQLTSYQGAMTDELALATLPTGEHNGLAIQVSQYLSINNKCENTEAAALFINFFVKNEEAGEILGTDRGIPSSPTVREKAQQNATEIDQKLFAYLDTVIENSIPQDPNLPNDQEFIDNLKLIGQQIAFGESSLEDGGQQLYDLIAKLMVK
ncbi:MAG TPA: extracellular solute-binding protein [Clostridiales bacterium]|nr:extracellular solute-binding protein [Clostridiales bacterium]